MAFLGTPYRVLYQSKNSRAGLTDVKAFVVKPDNSVAGLFTLTEYGFQSLAGVYYVDLMTSLNDVEGEWTAMIHSPSEGIKYPSRISFQSNPVNAIRVLVANFLANGIREELKGRVELLKEYTHYIESAPELTGFVLPEEVEADIESNYLKGEIENGMQ